jgi:predicted ATPase
LRVVVASSDDEPLPDRMDIPAQIAYERVRSFLARQESARPRMSSRSFAATYENNALLRRVVSLIDNIEETIDKIAEPRRQLQQVVTELFGKGKQIEFGDSRIIVTVEGGPISISRLSSGEKQLLRILVETIMAGSSPIIIDEPEISMHIDWQKKLLSVMRVINPEAQIIVATHSPEIMASFDDEKIFKL